MSAPLPLTDSELWRGFVDATLPAASFHHEEHVRVAWMHLRRYERLEALRLYSERLRRFATANGAPGRYHETITWAFLLLIQERMRGGDDAEPWTDFARRNPDLLDWKESVLLRYYRKETLASPLAREVFVLPDRGITPASARGSGLRYGI